MMQEGLTVTRGLFRRDEISPCSLLTLLRRIAEILFPH